MLGGFVLNDSNCLESFHLDWRLNGGKLHGKHQLIKGEKPRTNWSLHVHNLCPIWWPGTKSLQKKTQFFCGYGIRPPQKRRRYVTYYVCFFPRSNVESTKCCQTHPTVHPLRRWFHRVNPAVWSQDVQWRYSRPRESQLAPWTQNPRIVRGTGGGKAPRGVPDVFFLAASLKPVDFFSLICTMIIVWNSLIW